MTNTYTKQLGSFIEGSVDIVQKADTKGQKKNRVGKMMVSKDERIRLPRY